jgi:putative transposase
MPARNVALATGELYHLFNRSIARQPIFTRAKDNLRFIETVNYYRFEKPRLRYSHYVRLTQEMKNNFLNEQVNNANIIVEIFCFSLMPNHFHFLIRQLQEGGIKIFMSQIQNSYAKYFNLKYERSGSLFQEMFKGVRIESEEQFMHVSRYIHLNQLTGFVLTSGNELEISPWSSFSAYVGYKDFQFLSKDLLKSYFPNTETFKSFTFDQISYQRELHKISHLLLE